MNDSCGHSTLNVSSNLFKCGVDKSFPKSSQRRQKLSLKNYESPVVEALTLSQQEYENVASSEQSNENNDINTQKILNFRQEENIKQSFPTFSSPLKRKMVHDTFKYAESSPTPSCCSLQLKKIRLSILDYKPTNCNPILAKSKINRKSLNNGLSKSCSFSDSSLTPKYHTINGINIRKKIDVSSANLKAKIIVSQTETKSTSFNNKYSKNRIENLDSISRIQWQSKYSAHTRHKSQNCKELNQNPNCVSLVPTSKLIKKIGNNTRFSDSISGNFKHEYSLFKNCTICINPIKISCLTPKVQSSTNDAISIPTTKYSLYNDNKTKSSRKLPSVFHKSLPSDMIEVPKTPEQVAIHKDEVRKDENLQMNMKRTNGWTWIGEIIVTKSYLIGEVTINRHYYIGIRRADQIIYAHDNILMRPPYDKHEKPYVGKIASLWSDEVIDDRNTDKIQNQVRDCKHMMMTVYWYYQPEHLETGRLPHLHGDKEILSSKHYDENSIACIIGKAYVLAYNTFCRYKANKKLISETKDSKQQTLVSTIVPPVSSHRCEDQYPPDSIALHTVFFCRAGYNFYNGRIYSQTRSHTIYFTT